MSTVEYTPSYYALRVCPRAAGDSEWWRAARSAGDRAPRPIRALVAGRSRVELSAHDAAQALAWAERQPGWDDEPYKPVWVYTPAGDA